MHFPYNTFFIKTFFLPECLKYFKIKFKNPRTTKTTTKKIPNIYKEGMKLEKLRKVCCPSIQFTNILWA